MSSAQLAFSNPPRSREQGVMTTMAAIAGPRCLTFPPTRGDLSTTAGKKNRLAVQAVRVPALKRVESSRPVLPGLNFVSKSSFSRASPPPGFRAAALPEDDVAAETAEVLDKPAAGESAYEGPTVKVRFELLRECHYGQQFKVVGGDPQFGDWNPSAALPLTWSEGHLWTTEVDLPEGKAVEYKYVLTDGEGVVDWQPGSNQVLDTAAGAEPFIVFDEWEETQSELSADLEVQPADLEVPITEPEVQSDESDTGGWEIFSSGAEGSSPVDSVADVAASATIGALNLGVKAATALEGGLDAVSPGSDSPGTETNGVAESNEEEEPTAIEFPVVDAALAVSAEPAEPAEPAEEPLDTSNGASSATNNQSESATTEEKLTIEESKLEVQPIRIEEPKKRWNPLQKDIEWLSKTFFGR